MSRALALAVAVAAVSTASVAHAGTGPLYDAHAMVGQWLAAQNGHNYDAYAKFYADDAQAIIGGKSKVDDKTVPIATWMADRKKVLPTLTVETYGEQYGLEKTGNVTVLFNQVSRTPAGAEQAFKVLQLAPKDGTFKIWRESTMLVAPLAVGEDVAAGKSRVDAAFPKPFAPEIYGSSNCKGKTCAVSLIFGHEPGAAELPIGSIVNNPDGEDTGEFVAPVRGVKLVAAPPLGAAVLVVLENQKESGGEPLVRRATLFNPDHSIAWTGDLLTNKRAKDITYTVNGAKVKQAAPGPGKDVANPCRIAILPTELIHTCGKTSKTFTYKDGRFR
jgi:hypothetical protein